MNSADASSWTIEFNAVAERQLARLDRAVQSRILKFLETRVSPAPRRLGDPLHGTLKGLWRYRIGDYRILCRIEDDRLIVLVVTIGHRREVYER
jgi:mRNA interferase RelE/StbE